MSASEVQKSGVISTRDILTGNEFSELISFMYLICFVFDLYREGDTPIYDEETSLNLPLNIFIISLNIKFVTNFNLIRYNCIDDNDYNLLQF